MSKYIYEAYPANADVDAIKATNKKRAYNIGLAESKIMEIVDLVIKTDGLVTEDQVSELKEARDFLTAKRPRAPRKGSDKLSREEVLIALFENVDNLDAEGKISEFEVFKATKMGRAEVLGGLKKALDVAAPDHRVWVTFDPQEEVYALRGTGPTPPAGWTGKIPAPRKMEEDESAIGPE